MLKNKGKAGRRGHRKGKNASSSSQSPKPSSEPGARDEQLPLPASVAGAGEGSPVDGSVVLQGEGGGRTGGLAGEDGGSHKNFVSEGGAVGTQGTVPGGETSGVPGGEDGEEEGGGSSVMGTDIDQQLEEAAERRNLSVLNVKSILHVRIHAIQTHVLSTGHWRLSWTGSSRTESRPVQCIRAFMHTCWLNYAPNTR